MTAKDHYRAGLREMTSGDLEKALACFQEALVVDPAFSIAQLGMCQVLDRQGRVDEAIEHARKAIDLDPDDALAHASLSRLYQQKGMITEAEDEMAISRKLEEGS